MAHVMLRLYVEHVLTAKLVKRSDFISLGVVVLVVHFCLLVSTTYKDTNLMGYNKSQPLTSVDQMVYVSPMLSSTQHRFKPVC
jgi:hypothetical protein